MVERTRRFAVVLEPEEAGGFTVRVPGLPEIVTYGKDEAEALTMAEDAIRLVLEDMTARGARGYTAHSRGYRHAGSMTDRLADYR